MNHRNQGHKFRDQIKKVKRKKEIVFSPKAGMKFSAEIKWKTAEQLRNASLPPIFEGDRLEVTQRNTTTPNAGIQVGRQSAEQRLQC